MNLRNGKQIGDQFICKFFIEQKLYFTTSVGSPCKNSFTSDNLASYAGDLAQQAHGPLHVNVNVNAQEKLDRN